MTTQKTDVVASGMLRILETGKYQLTDEFVALASNPVLFLKAGFEFNVTQVAEMDSVVFIPEFGGWTYCEIPAIKVEMKLTQFTVRFRTVVFWSTKTVEANSPRAAAEKVLNSPVFFKGSDSGESYWSSVNRFGGEAVVLR